MERHDAPRSATSWKPISHVYHLAILRVAAFHAASHGAAIVRGSRGDPHMSATIVFVNTAAYGPLVGAAATTNVEQIRTAFERDRRARTLEISIACRKKLLEIAG